MGPRNGIPVRATCRKWIVILLVVALVAPLLTESASAAQITYQSVTGIWHDPMDNEPGSQPGDPVITNGNPTSIVRWGTTNGSQSGYDYTATVPPPFTLPGPIPFFSLGSFTHRNFEVSDPSLTSVQLDVVLVLAVDGVPTGPLTFTFTFNHEETPNNATPCPYPTPPGEGCTDRVTIVASPQPTTFNVGGVDYTLAMNFLVNGQPANQYITREGGTTNSSGLVGEFILPPGTPALTVEKSGPATMNPAEWGNFVIDVRNVGDVDAFDATLVDRLPDGPTGGMCDTTPQVLSARVFAADGVTPVAGKGPLTQGTDYSLAYNGAACQLTFNTLTAASVIGATQRLIVAYRTQLDANTQYNAALTNVVGATEWSNGPDINPTRTVYTRTLTNGTVGIVDHEDAHTVTVVPRWYAEKSAALQVDGMSPGIVDAGDVLRYTIRMHNNGGLPITQAVLRDSVPANTTYVADSMTLNGQPVGRPDGGVSPLDRGRRRELVEPDAAAAGRGSRHADTRPIGRRHVRSARERRRAARHGDREPGRRRYGRAAESIDRRRRQPRDGARADRRRRRQPAGAAHHEERRRGRRRAGHRGRHARVPRAGHERRRPAGLCRRDPRRHRGADAGLPHVRGSVVVAERLDERDHRRGLAADRRLLDDLWRPAAGRERSRCASAPCWTRTWP